MPSDSGQNSSVMHRRRKKQRTVPPPVYSNAPTPGLKVRLVVVFCIANDVFFSCFLMFYLMLHFSILEISA